MAYTALSNAQIAAGEPTTTEIFSKVKSNFDDHETRISDLESSASIVLSTLTTTSTTNAAYTNMITSLPAITVFGGNPVEVKLIGGTIYAEGPGTELDVFFALFRDATMISESRLHVKTITAVVGNRYEIPSGAVSFIDTGLPAGTFTYSLKAKVTVGLLVGIDNVKLAAYEVRL